MSKTLKPCGHFLTVELEGVVIGKTTESGIVYDIDVDKSKAEQAAFVRAKVVRVGINCWTGFTDPNGDWHAWCKAGDWIMLAQHAGQKFPPGDDLSKEEKEQLNRMRIIKDDDVLGVWVDEELAEVSK